MSTASSSTAQFGVVSRWSPAAATLAVLSFIAALCFPFVRFAPNRLMSGQPVDVVQLLQGPQSAWAMALAGLLVVWLLTSAAPASRIVLWLRVVVLAVSMPGWLALAASHAAQVAGDLSPFARTSLGAAFWLLWALTALALADTLQRLQAGRPTRVATVLLVLGAIAWLLLSRRCDELSLLKEYANRSEVFAQAISRHGQIVGLALAFTLVLGLPLGWAAHRDARVGPALLPVLNIVQTIPSIALFGLLMAPLAWLAAHSTVLTAAGISGVGLAPGVIALTLYSLLPVVRGTLAGLAQVPASVTQSAVGLGMDAREIFWRVEVPLALPVVLAGVRTAAIQAVGLAAVTALIGAGGLGAIMFEGLFSNAQDLVLLGVLPIVAMGMAVDAGFSLLAEAAARVADPARRSSSTPPLSPATSRATA